MSGFGRCALCSEGVGRHGDWDWDWDGYVDGEGGGRVGLSFQVRSIFATVTCFTPG